MHFTRFVACLSGEKTICWRWFLVFVSCCVYLSKPAGAQPAISTIVYQGMAVPGFAPGTEFLSLGVPTGYIPPVVNVQGHTAFLARITGGQDGVWLADANGVISNVALEGQQAPGAASGVTYRDFSSRLILDGRGNLAFGCRLSNNDEALFVLNTAGTRMVISTSTLLPNTNGNPDILDVTDNFFVATDPDFVFNADRMAILVNSVQHDDPTPSSPGDREGLNGIWSERPVSASALLQVVARTGTDTIFTGSVGPPVINGLGQVAFRGVTSEPGFGARPSLWSEGAGTGTLTRVAQGGATNAQGDVEFVGFGNPVMNTAGQNAFTTILPNRPLDQNSAIFLQQPQQAGIVANENTAAPGVAGVFADFVPNPGNLVVNQAGHIAFNSVARRDGMSSVNGIWARRGPSMEAVAVTGQPAPDTDGLTFLIPSNSLPVMNAFSDIAFYAQLTDESGTGVGDGIWAEHNGVLQRVIGSGDTVQLPDGSSLTIGTGDIDFIGGSGNEDGRPSGFADNGQIVLRVSRIGMPTPAYLKATLFEYLPGDTDGDGDIDDSDLGTAFANYSGPVGVAAGNNITDGYTDGDGDVDDSDLGTAFSGYTGPLGPNNVPEPTTCAVLGLGFLLTLRRTRCV